LSSTFSTSSTLFLPAFSWIGFERPLWFSTLNFSSRFQNRYTLLGESGAWLQKMDYAASFFEGRTSNWSYGTMKNFSTISGPVRYHLQRVCFLSLSLSLPLLIHFCPFILSFLSFWGLFFGFFFSVSVACLCWLVLLPVRATFLFVILCFNKIWKVHIAFFCLCYKLRMCMCVCLRCTGLHDPSLCSFRVCGRSVHAHAVTYWRFDHVACFHRHDYVACIHSRDSG
jgi:hypothetical protein